MIVQLRGVSDMVPATTEFVLKLGLPVCTVNCMAVPAGSMFVATDSFFSEQSLGIIRSCDVVPGLFPRDPVSGCRY